MFVKRESKFVPEVRGCKGLTQLRLKTLALGLAVLVATAMSGRGSNNQRVSFGKR